MSDMQRQYSFECPTCKSQLYFDAEHIPPKVFCDCCKVDVLVPEQKRSEAILFRAISEPFTPR